MSWKEKRLITVLSIILAVLFAAVLIVLSMRYRASQAAKAADVQTMSQDGGQSEQGDYVSLFYDNGSATLSFVRNETGSWYWESEPSFPLNDETVQSILALLRSMKPQQTLDMPEDLATYGLDSPHATLTATTAAGAALTIAMGNSTTDGNSYYVTINNDDHVYIIADTLYLAMQKPIYEMCVLPELPDLTEDSLTSVMLQGPKTETEDAEGMTHMVTILTAAHGEDGTVSWRSGGANVTDAADVRALLEDLEALRVSRCVDFKPSDEAAAFCGFEDASALTVNYQTAAGAAESFVMYIGNQNMDGTGRYVRIGEETAIYLVELSLLDPMMRLAYQGLEG